MSGDEWRGWARDLRRARAEPRRLPTVLRRLRLRLGSQKAEQRQIDSHLMAIGRGETGAEESALGFVRKKVVAMAPLGRIPMGRPRLSEWSLMEIPALRACLSSQTDRRTRRALAAKLRRRESMAAPNSPRFRAWLAPYEAPLDPGDKYAGFSERELDGVLRRSVKASLVANESPARSGTPPAQNLGRHRSGSD